MASSSSSTEKPSSSSSTEKPLSSSSSTEKKVIVLISQEGETFDVEEEAALLSQTVKNMVDDDCTAGGIPLPNVDAATLGKVIEYCKGHVAAADEKDLQTFESEFLDSVKDDNLKLFNLILAANYLNIKQLLDLTCQAVADMIKDKTPEEVRLKFDIKNDFTPEEEAEVRRENAWAFE